MQAGAERPFFLEDYRPFRKALVDAEDESVLLGGPAVCAWVELFLDETECHHFDLPVFSRDIDLRGRGMTCLALTKLMQSEGAIPGGSSARSFRISLFSGSMRGVTVGTRCQARRARAGAG